MAIVKAVIGFIEVFLLSFINLPFAVNVSYTNGEYIAPEITTPMYIVEDGETDFVIVTSDSPD
jgi:hypothetical protein